MKVAISIPDSVFKAGDALARKRKISRSQLYAEAVAAYLGAHGADAIRERLDAVYATQDSSVDPGLVQAQLETLDPNETW